MDNITITKIWQDDGFWQAEVYAKSSLISAKTKFYISDKQLNKLSKLLEIYYRTEFTWDITEFKNGPTNMSIHVFPKDSLGHVVIDIYMLIKDLSDNGEHNCRFAIESEIGLLNQFGKRLKKLNEAVLYQSISLNDEENNPL